jgi:subtilisin family serine protease
MRKLSALVLAAAPLAGALAAMPQHPQPVYREGEVLVTWRDAAVAKAAGPLKTRLGLSTRRQLRGGRLELLALPSFLTTAQAMALLRDDPSVERAGPNFLRWPRQALPNDTSFADQWGLHNSGQPDFDAVRFPAGTVDADMDLPEAWDSDGDGVFDRTGDGIVTIAIVDDAFMTDHPDLAANFVAGYNFVNENTDVSPEELEQHGTRVAGAAGAVGNNGIGVAGTAWNVRLMPLKFDLDVASHIAALEFAAANGADIVNASFGGPSFDASEQDAIRALAEQGILYVAAAGNDDSNTDFAQLSYPSNDDAPNIVAVAASDRQDDIAGFSEYGALTTDVAAPGVQVVTTTIAPGYSAPTPDCGFGGSCGVSGTSFAAPYVAGVAALLKSHVAPIPGFMEMKARLIEGADAVDKVLHRTSGGRVNAAKALDLAPRPSLVIEAIDWVDDNDRLDPGEALAVDVTLRNLWQDASGITGTLAADNGVAVDPAPVAFADLPHDATATARFALTVDPGIAEHRYVRFTLQLAAGGYAATRGFMAEIGRLENGVLVTDRFLDKEVDDHDDFHAWHFDLPALPEGHRVLVIETTATAARGRPPDVDLLVRHGEPPRYSIKLGPGPHVFCTSGTTLDCLDPATLVSAQVGGTERVAISDPPLGTYHIVVVNFAQLPQNMTYTLRAYTHDGTIRGSLFGGSLPAPALGLFALAALVHRRWGRTRLVPCARS